MDIQTGEVQILFLYDLEYLKTKKLGTFKSFFNTYTLPADYISNVSQLLLDNYFARNTKFEKIYTCSFDMSEFDTFEKLVTLALSFLWYEYNRGPNWNSRYESLKIAVRSEYDRIFHRLPLRVDSYTLFCELKDVFVGAMLLLTKCEKEVRSADFLREVIHTFVSEKPFKTDRALDSVIGKNIPTIFEGLEDFYEKLNCKKLVQIIDTLISGNKDISRKDAMSLERQRDLEKLLYALDCDSEEVKWVIKCLPVDHNGRTTIAYLLRDLHNGERIHPPFLRQKISDKLQEDHFVKINGESVCPRCWIREKTAYTTYYYKLKSCETHKAVPATKPLSILEPQPSPSAPSPVSNGECPVCLEKQKNVAFTSCGHLVCSECSLLVTLCPICRTKISGRLTVYV